MKKKVKNDKRITNKGKSKDSYTPQEWMLALRAVTSRPLSYFLDNISVIEAKAIGDTDPDYGVMMAEGDQYTTGDLRSTCNLVTHHDSWEWSTLAYKVIKRLLNETIKYFLYYVAGIHNSSVHKMSPKGRLF